MLLGTVKLRTLGKVAAMAKRVARVWDLKAFEGQGLRARLCCRKISDSIFWLHCFTPR